MKYFVSACLLGENCKYNGGNNANEELIEFLQDKDVVRICPEVLGGLSTPRPCAEIHAGRVINTLHEDVSDAYAIGAQKAVDIAIKEGIDIAITQSRSPSCGKGKRYSGRFDQILINGNGVFVDRMEENGFTVIDVAEFVDNQKANRKKKNCPD